LHLPRTKAGKIEVDATMAVSGHPGLWAVGDSAAIPDVITGGLCPPTAQYAIRQGKRLAQNIAAVLEGREAEPFKFKTLGVLAGLGRRSAVAEILGIQFSGFVAWWLFRTIYLMKLPGFERKLRVAIDWTLDLFFMRDIVYLRPLHTARGPGDISREAEAGKETRSVESPMQERSVDRSDRVHARAWRTEHVETTQRGDRSIPASVALRARQAVHQLPSEIHLPQST
jgi:hypothetical protein